MFTSLDAHTRSQTPTRSSFARCKNTLAHHYLSSLKITVPLQLSLYHWLLAVAAGASAASTAQARSMCSEPTSRCVTSLSTPPPMLEASTPSDLSSSMTWHTDVGVGVKGEEGGGCLG